MLGREVRLPLDLIYEQPQCSRNDLSPNKYVDTMGDRLQRDFRIARENLHRAAPKYNTDVKREEIAVGQRFPKWTKFYTSQYIVAHIIDSHVV